MIKILKINILNLLNLTLIKLFKIMSFSICKNNNNLFRNTFLYMIKNLAFLSPYQQFLSIISLIRPLIVIN